MSPMVRRSITLEFALLGFLRQGPLHGYQLYRQLCDPAGLGRVWRLKQAQLYALLDKLEKDGYVTSSLQPQKARPARRVFSLTAAGERTFQDWLSTPVQAPRQMRQEFQAKLYFSQRESQEAPERLIAVQRAACQHWLEYQQTLAIKDDHDHSYAWQVDQYRVGQIRAMLDWLDICQEKLK